jgi:hypothetical protein
MRSINMMRSEPIPPGRCAFQGCATPRLGGVWNDGGSYCCILHQRILMPVRIYFDKLSPQANTYRDINRRDKELLKRESSAYHKRLGKGLGKKRAAR